MAVILGKGSKLQLSIASVYTDIAQLVEVTFPNEEMGQIETTDLASTVRTYAATILEPGTVGFKINYDPDSTTHAQLNTSFTAGTTEAWKCILPSPAGSIFAFSGFVTKFSPEAQVVDGKFVANLEIKLTGAVTLTP